MATMSEVREGDSIPGLDNGYVFEVESTDETDVSLRTGSDYPYVIPEGYVLLTLHDADGEEFYLIAPAGMRLTLDR